MNNDSTQAPARIYGFARRKKHFEWIEPGPENPAASPGAAVGGVLKAELLDDVTHLAASGSEVAQEMLQALESEAVPAPRSSDSAEAEPDPSQASQPEKPRLRRRTKISAVDSESPLGRHQRRCVICGSRYQDEIEDAFVNWESVDTIARSFHIDRRSVYRHAHATGLFAQRDCNIRRALGHLIHRADKVRDVSADSIIGAVKALAHINEHGRWTAPPTHIIVSSGKLIDTSCRSERTLTP